MDISERELEVLRAAFDWARTGAAASLEEFLIVGGPVNLTNGAGDTLLILAAYHGHARTVQLLLDHDADVDRYNDNGQTALAAATFRRRTDIMTMLLGAGADPGAGTRSARVIADFFGLHDMAAVLSNSHTHPRVRTAADQRHG